MAEKLIYSVKKALDILDILAFGDYQHNGIKLSELSRLTEIKPNTLRGLLLTLINCGYAEQGENGLYYSGKRTRQIGILNRFSFNKTFSAQLDNALHSLCEKVGESVSFYVLDKGERINYANIQANNIIKIDYTMLDEKSIYEYPSGKVLTAYASDEELLGIVAANGYPNEVWNGIDNFSDLKVACEEIRKVGYSTRIDKKNIEASFAVPVFDKDGNVFGSLGIYTFAARINPEREKMLLDNLFEFADKIKHFNERM